MTRCWNAAQRDRPPFTCIVDELQAILDEGDFNIADVSSPACPFPELQCFWKIDRVEENSCLTTSSEKLSLEEDFTVVRIRGLGIV